MPLPAPETWDDGEAKINIPTAKRLNSNWKDSFDFLIGYQLPMIYLQSSTSQTLAANTFVTVNMQVETLKRGGMTHAANAATAAVPYTGQYTGYMYGGFGTFSTLVGKMKIRLLKNSATQIADAQQTPENLTGSEVTCSFTANLTAGDTVSMQQLYTATGGSSTSISLHNRPKLALWYTGDFA